MALSAIVDDIDGVPEGLRDHYEETDGKYRLKVDGVEHLTPEGDKAQILADLAKERRKRQALEKQFKGLDLDEIEAMRERLSQIEEDTAAGKGDWEKAKAQLTERYTKDLGKAKESEERLRRKLEKVLRQDAALQAVTAHDGIATALQHHVETFVDLVEEDGELKAVARGLDGAEVESIDVLVKQMKESGDYDWGFKPNGATGGGAGGRRAGGASSVKSRSKLSVADKAAFIREHGSEAYLKLPE